MYKNTTHTTAHWSYKVKTDRRTYAIFLETKDQCNEILKESQQKFLSIGLISSEENQSPDITKKDVLTSRKHIINIKNKSINFLKNYGIPYKIIDSLPQYFLVFPLSKKILIRLVESTNTLDVPHELRALHSFLKSRKIIKERKKIKVVNSRTEKSTTKYKSSFQIAYELAAIKKLNKDKK